MQIFISIYFFTLDTSKLWNLLLQKSEYADKDVFLKKDWPNSQRVSGFTKLCIVPSMNIIVMNMVPFGILDSKSQNSPRISKAEFWEFQPTRKLVG